MFGRKMLRRHRANLCEHFPVSQYKTKLDINVPEMQKLFACVVLRSKVKLSHAKVQSSGTKFCHMKLKDVLKIFLSHYGFWN